MARTTLALLVFSAIASIACRAAAGENPAPTVPGGSAFDAGRLAFQDLDRGALDPERARKLAEDIRPSALRGRATTQFETIYRALDVLAHVGREENTINDEQDLLRYRELWDAWVDLLQQEDFRGDADTQVFVIGELIVYVLARASVETLTNDPGVQRDDRHLDLVRAAIARSVIESLPRDFEDGGLHDRKLASMEYLLDQPHGLKKGDGKRTPRHDGWLDERFGLWLGQHHALSMSLVYDPSGLDPHSDPLAARAHFLAGRAVLERVAEYSPQSSHKGLALVLLTQLESAYPDDSQTGGAAKALKHNHIAVLRGMEAQVVGGGDLEEADMDDLRAAVGDAFYNVTLGYWTTEPDPKRVDTYSNWLSYLRGDTPVDEQERVHEINLANWNQAKPPITAVTWDRLKDAKGQKPNAQLKGIPAWVPYYIAAMSALGVKQDGGHDLPTQSTRRVKVHADRFSLALSDALQADELSPEELQDARKYTGLLIEYMTRAVSSEVQPDNEVEPPPPGAQRVEQAGYTETIAVLEELMERMVEDPPGSGTAATEDPVLHQHAPRNLPDDRGGFESLLLDQVETLVLRRHADDVCGEGDCSPATAALPALLTHGIYRIEDVSYTANPPGSAPPTTIMARLHRDLITLLDDPRDGESVGIAQFLRLRMWPEDLHCTDEKGTSGCTHEELHAALWGAGSVLHPSEPDSLDDVQLVQVWFPRQADLATWVSQQQQSQNRRANHAWGVNGRDGDQSVTLRLFADAVWREALAFCATNVRATTFSTPVRDDKYVQIYLPAPSGGIALISEDGEILHAVIRQGTGGVWLNELVAEGSDLRMHSPLLVLHTEER